MRRYYLYVFPTREELSKATESSTDVRHFLASAGHPLKRRSQDDCTAADIEAQRRPIVSTAAGSDAGVSTWKRTEAHSFSIMGKKSSQRFVLASSLADIMLSIQQRQILGLIVFIERLGPVIQHITRKEDKISKRLVLNFDLDGFLIVDPFC